MEMLLQMQKLVRSSQGTWESPADDLGNIYESKPINVYLNQQYDNKSSIIVMMADLRPDLIALDTSCFNANDNLITCTMEQRIYGHSLILADIFSSLYSGCFIGFDMDKIKKLQDDKFHVANASYF